MLSSCELKSAAAGVPQRRIFVIGVAGRTQSQDLHFEVLEFSW